MKERTNRETIEWLRAGLKKAADNIDKQLKARKETPESRDNDLASALAMLQLGHLKLAQDQIDQARELFNQAIGILLPGGAIRPDLPMELKRNYDFPLYVYLAGGRALAASVAGMVLNEYARQRLPGEVMVLHEGRCALLAMLAGDRLKAVWFSGLIEEKCRDIVISADGTLSPGQQPEPTPWQRALKSYDKKKLWVKISGDFDSAYARVSGHDLWHDPPSPAVLRKRARGLFEMRTLSAIYKKNSTWFDENMAHWARVHLRSMDANRDSGVLAAKLADLDMIIAYDLALAEGFPQNIVSEFVPASIAKNGWWNRPSAHPLSKSPTPIADITGENTGLVAAARASFQEGDLHDCLVLANRAIEADENDKEAWSLKADALAASGDFKNSVRAYSRLVELAPESTDAWFRKGQAAFELERYKDAVACFNMVVELEPSHRDGLLQLVDSYIKSYKKDDGIRILDSILSNHPDDFDAWIKKGEILNKYHPYTGAVECFDRALAIRPSDLAALLGKAAALDHRNTVQEAMNLYRRIVTNYPKAPEAFEAWKSVYRHLVNEKDYSEALKWCDSALSLDGEAFREVWRFRGYVLDDLKRPAECLTNWESAIQANPYSEEAWTEKARQMFKMEKEEGLEPLDRALDINPAYEEALTLKTNILMALERYDEADTAFDHWIIAIPDDFDAYKGKGDIALEKKDYVEALRYYSKAEGLHKINADRGNLFLSMGNAYLNLEKYDEALNYYNRSIECEPEANGAMQNKGMVLYKLGRYQEAQAALEKSIGIGPINDVAWFYRGETYNKLEMEELAHTCYEEALKINPEHKEALLRIGSILTREGKLNDALKIFERLTKVYPDLEVAWAVKAEVLTGLRNYPEALRCCEYALMLDSKDADCWANKGQALDRLGNHAEAFRCYEYALQLAPEDSNNWNNMGVGLLNHDRYSEALQYFDKAIALDRTDADPLSNKGLGLIGLKRYDEAIACLEQALNIDPNHEQAQSNLKLALKSKKGGIFKRLFIV